ncbi:MAG: YeeE/YedE family protein [Desulfobulbaceae bacterium]|nr:YeeE/YedE family protein [Desulfobulbaceae bacterium]
MSEESIFGSKVKGLYNDLCRKEWNANTVGILVALFSILIMAWWRPWGAVGAVRNWGDWMMYGLTSLVGSDAGIFGLYEDAPRSILVASGSVIGIGFVAGAFVSACLGNDFAFRIPPVLEMCKAVAAGIFMGIGATMAGGCNVGGFYNAIGNLSAHGFAMWVGLVAGAITGLKYIYWEMEHISWGSGGAKTIELPSALNMLLGFAGIAALIAGTYIYSGNEDSDYIASLGGLLLISSALGYCMQRGRWCMIQGFREPHMTGNATMAKAVALSVFIVALGAVVLKYGVPVRIDGDPVLATAHYVRGTFGWGGVVGGFIFAFGAMLAGGCGTGTLWRVGEGQIKLWIVVPFFALSNSIMTSWFKDNDFEADGVLGRYVYLPDVFGYTGTLFLIGFAMVTWYLIVSWNEDANKLIVDM